MNCRKFLHQITAGGDGACVSRCCLARTHVRFSENDHLYCTESFLTIFKLKGISSPCCAPAFQRKTVDGQHPTTDQVCLSVCSPPKVVDWFVYERLQCRLLLLHQLEVVNSLRPLNHAVYCMSCSIVCIICWFAFPVRACMRGCFLAIRYSIDAL